VLARLRAAGQAEYAAAAVRATRDGLLLTLPIVVGLYGCSDLVIRLLFGADLAGAGEILRILAWAVVPFSIAIVLAQVLFAADRQAVDLGVNVVSMVVSVAGAAILVSRFGAAGAAVAVVAASSVYAVLQYAGVLRWAAPLGLGSDLLRVAALTATALAVHWGFSWAGPIVATALALTSFGVGCGMLGLVPMGELRRRVGGRPVRDSHGERVAL
jgi:O-antigen/teichoic acid export membrane protein